MTLGRQTVDIRYITIHVTFDVRGVITQLYPGNGTINDRRRSNRASYGIRSQTAGVSSLKAPRNRLDGKDVFISLPTGFGKLMCFQTLPFVYDCLDSDPE